MAKNFIEKISVKSFALNNPQHLNIDGSLEKLHNMRYIDGGLENVSEFKLRSQITDFNDFKILYTHLDNYLAVNSSDELHHVEIIAGVVTSKTILKEDCNRSSLNINHFGNALIVTLTDTQQYFIYKDEKYSVLRFEEIQPIDNINISCEYAFSEPYNDDYDSPIYGYNSSDGEICTEYTNHIATFNNDDYIYGATYIIAAYKLYDGSIVKNGRAVMVPTEATFGNFTSRFTRLENMEFPNGTTYEYCYFKKLSASKPTIKITIDQEAMNNDLISSVVIYATRPENIYDMENIHDIYETTPYSADYPGSSSEAKYFYEKDYENYIKRPFYEIKEVKNSNLESATITFTMGYKEHIEGMEFNATYTPSFSAHTTTHRSMFEYNARIHSYNQLTKLYCGTLLSHSSDTFKYFNDTYYRVELPTNITLEYTVTIRVDDNLYELKSGNDSYAYIDSETASEDSVYVIPIDCFISYPDYRAEAINIYYSDGIGRHLLHSIELSPSLSNNLAYNYQTRIALAGNYCLSSISPSFFSRKAALCPEHEGVISKNKIMVSNQNNPFSYDPLNIYQIDGSDCEIYSITTTADQITENSYGKHPLVIFTSKGIYALEQGSDTILYSNVVLLDGNITSSNIESVAYGGILYFTADNRVMSLNSRSVTTISAALECSSDRDINVAINIDDYFQNAKLYSLRAYDEIMLYNTLYNAALIYNTKNGCWATRSLSADHLSSTLLVGEGGIFSLTDKENKTSALAPHIITNVLKMNSDDLKKLEYLKLIFSKSENASIDTTLFASNDLNNWYTLSRSSFGRPLSRSGSSWRYFKVKIKYNPPTINKSYYLYLSALEFKYSIRYENIL